MEPLDLIRLQISLEYQLDPNGRLVPFPGSSERAWYLVYRYDKGYVPYFNHLLPPEVRQRLLVLGPTEAFVHPSKVIKLISESHQPCRGGGEVFWSGYFTNPPDPDEFPEASKEGEAWVVKVEGQVVCQAISVRQNEQCHEAYVETHPDFRKRGFGRQVVAAWASQVMRRGQTALYSYRMNNLASAALAKSAGVCWYADLIGFE